MTPAAHPLLTLLWLPLLVGLQSIPGTGALRTLMLLLGLAHILWWWSRSRPPLGTVHGGVELWLLLALSAWLLVQTAFISPTPESSLVQWVDEWLQFLLMALVGINIARLHGPASRWLVVALFAGAFLHVLSTLGLQVQALMSGGAPAYGNSLLGNYGYVSPFTTAAFAWLLADTANRLWHDKKLFPWPGWVLAFFMLLTLAADIFLMAKAAQVMILLLVGVVLAGFLWHGKIRRKAVLLALPLVVLGAAAVLHFGSERWHGATESIALAWEGPLTTETLTGSNDPNARVNQVEQSFYLRMLWARTGLEGIADHPLGLGYGADAFGRYVHERFGIPGLISSHSGWIDFALANGVIGLALFLALALALVRRGYLSFLSGNPAGAALMLLVVHFVGRALIDGHLAGSRLTGFALVAGALWAMCAPQKNAARPD